MSPLQSAEAAKLRARLQLLNAEWHAREVRERFGSLSPEYRVAVAVVEAERRKLVAAIDEVIDLSRPREAAR